MVTPLSPPPEAEDKLRDIRSITDAALSYLGADEPVGDDIALLALRWQGSQSDPIRLYIPAR